MPDISLCGDPDCPLRADCRRSPDSGTVPKPDRQTWSLFSWTVQHSGAEAECHGFWPRAAEVPKPKLVEGARD